MSNFPALSSLAQFDDLMRCSKELIAGIAEEKFLLFLHQYETIKVDYQRILDEVRDLQNQLDEQTQQTIALDRKLNYARKMLEMERKSRREVDAGKAQLEAKLDSLRTMLSNDHTMKDETRRHLQVLSSYSKKRKSNYQPNEDDIANDMNSTGSFLSDLSLTQSGDDLLDPKSTTNNVKWKKHRPSLNNSGILLNTTTRKSLASAEKRKSARQSILEYGSNDKIVSQTKLIIPTNKRAPIYADTIIKSFPKGHLEPSTSSSDGDQNMPSHDSAAACKTPTPTKTPFNKNFFTPSAPLYDDLDNVKDDVVYATVKKRPTATISSRPHNFSSKTFLKPESCGFCTKKIRFGSVGSKCTSCRTNVHQDCRDKLTITCVAQNGTPMVMKSGTALGQISDYTPDIAPMVPALIVHCVNEIETRGLNEVGLYRISGSERDVKALKEKFLRNNGIPCLSEIDVHVLCGCVKDFLRSLRERLIPMTLWTLFSNAAQRIPSEDDSGTVSKDIYHAIEILPQANRDTLAYLMMHFQRLSECPDVKMPLTNFAKIFGPTIIGYSCAEPDQHMMFAETQVQYSVMFSLLNVPTDYWSKFITLNKPTRQEENREIETYGRRFYSGTPSMKVVRKERKFYNTPPYSAISKKKK